jgi:hypothetical protein
MNYELMSDFEINKVVAMKRGFSVDKEQYEGLCDRDERIVLCRDNFDISIGFDPCNDPADAWPVISENKISIEYRDHKSLAPVAKRFGSNSHNISHENPLRAAMIVFLMMQND